MMAFPELTVTQGGKKLHKTRTRFKVLTVAVTVALLSAACGSDDETSSTNGETTVAASAAPVDTTAETTADTTAGTTADTTTAESTPAASAEDSAEWQAVVEAAKAEGSLTIYSGLPETQLNLMADGFNAEYGIDVAVQRIVGPELATRFSTEADAGSVAADVILLTSSPIETSEDWLSKGWIQAVDDANLPVLIDGGYPADYNTGTIATISIQPWGIAYNSDLLSADEAPQSFEELADPKWKDQMVAADPTASAAYLSIFTALRNDLGQEWFDGFRANDPTWFPAGTPAGQSLGAGERAVLAVTAPSLAFELKNAGAPVELIIPDYTAGFESYVTIVAEGLSEHPNASKLFANWLLTEEGSAIGTDFPGGFSPYSPDLPSQYQRFAPDELISSEELKGLLGL